MSIFKVPLQSGVFPALTSPQLSEIDGVLRDSGLVVLPTDTVYGIATAPYDAPAVARLQTAKGRGEDFPPPVLVSGPDALDDLFSSATTAPASPAGPLEMARVLAEKFWPGPLTIIAPAPPELGWDLGRTAGTVALRMPDHPVALQVLGHTGPLAVTSANLHGAPPATNVKAALEYFGDLVGVYVDAGPSPTGLPSSIVNLSSGAPQMVREGAISLAQLSAALN